MRVLLVEDEAMIARIIQRGLEEAHLLVHWAGDGPEALELIDGNAYALILLDIMLPGMDGLALCRLLRARRDSTPILMLTARDTVDDRIIGLDTGADDYLIKPFDFRELLARVRALLRRDKIHRSGCITVADLEIDTNAQTVRRGGREIVLTPREYTLLHGLAANQGRVLTRDIICGRIWMDEETHLNSIAVYISKLRKKIDDEHSVKLIHTVHGFGYTLKPVENAEEP